MDLKKKKGKDASNTSFLPLNHRRGDSQNDPNFGWGISNNNNEVEMITIIPSSSRVGSFAATK